MTTPPLLSLRDIRKTRRQDTAFSLRIPALDVHCGERVALVGESGCGKSTALDLVGTVLRPDLPDSSRADTAPLFHFAPAGSVGPPVDVLELWRRNRRDAMANLRRAHLGYILQTGGLLPFLNAQDNILLHQARRDAALLDNLHTLARRLDIAHLLKRLPGQLSVGQRQRVAIARALVGNPALVLADEPAAALDPLNAQVVLELFTHLAEELHVAVIMVTHAPDSAAAMGFRMVHIHTTRDGDDVHATLDASTATREGTA